MEKKLRGLRQTSEEPNFWQDSERAGKIQKRITLMSEELDLWRGIQKELGDIKEYLVETGEADSNFLSDVESQLAGLERAYEKEEYRIFLSGENDASNAYVSIYPGAGGLDASEWASMLLRMYQRYCEKKGWKAGLIEESYVEGGGLKQATFFVESPYAYGFLKGEQGAHRLVRLSPFSSANLRHTSFASVEVFPEVEDTPETHIPKDEIKVDLFRSSGPGGQNANKRETAVRLTHIPTGISATSQQERSQSANRQHAYKLLCSKVHICKIKEYNDKMESVKGELVSPEWGNQIRSYVLHPYTLVKDYRTDIETSSAKDVLDGDIDSFIQATIRKRAIDNQFI